MKKKLVKAGSYIGLQVFNFSVSYGFARLVSWIASKFITEENAKKHPWLCLLGYLAYLAVLVAFPIWWVFRPLYYINDWIDEKIEKAYPENDEDFE